MTPSEYQVEASRTDSNTDDTLYASLRNAASRKLLHACLGLSTETGEFVDSMKRSLFYGTPLDVDNVKEELGDLLWYISLALSSIGSSFEEVMEANVSKLRRRYKDGFSQEAAVSRADKEVE